MGWLVGVIEREDDWYVIADENDYASFKDLENEIVSCCSYGSVLQDVIVTFDVRELHRIIEEEIDHDNRALGSVPRLRLRL